MPSFLTYFWKNGLLAFLVGLVLTACNTQSIQTEQQKGALVAGKDSRNADHLLIVDCLLPGQVRKLGTKLTYLTARRPIKTTAGNCEIRGGEYTAYDRANYATALKIWLPQAQQGDSAAQAYVGEIYEKGLGIQPDYALAAQWYKKAAEQGSSRAMINMGFLYERGLGVSRDLPTSLNWYRKASGLEGEDLAFASTIEAAETTAYEQQLLTLRNQISQRDETVSALRTQLEKAQRQLARRKANLQRLQRDIEKTRRDLEMRKKLQNNSSSHNTFELQRKEQQLQQRQAKLEEQTLLISLRSTGADQEKLRLDGELKAAQNQQRALQAKLKSSQSESNHYKKQLKQTQKQLEIQQNGLVKAQNKVKQLRSKFVQKSAAQGTDNSAQLKGLQIALETQNKKASQQQQNVEQLQLQLAEYKNRLITERQKSNSKASTLQNRKSEIEILRKDLASKENNLAKAQVQLDAAEGKLKTLRTQKGFQNQGDTQQLVLLKQQYQKAAEKTVKIEQDKNNLQKQLQQTQSKQQELRNTLQKSQKNTATYKTKLDRLQNLFEQERQALSSTEQRLKQTQSRFNQETQISATTSSELQVLQTQLKQSENRLVNQEAQIASLRVKQQAKQATLQNELHQSQAKEQQQQAELQQHQTELTTLHEDLGSIRKENTQVKSRLIQREKELQQAQIQIEKERKVFEQRLTQQGSAATTRNDLEIQRLEALGKKQKNELKAQQQLIAQLEQDNVRRRKAVPEKPTAKITQREQGLGGPIIEIIEPPLVATRGTATLSIRLRSRVPNREIIGRATAPSGLFALNVNDRKTTVNEVGIFRSSIPIQRRKETPVSIVALDNQGKRSSLEFVFIPEDKKIISTPTLVSAASTSIKSGGIDFGKYYALVIGNNNYQHLENLKTAKNDARVVADLLETRYGFDVTLLTDANRYAILTLLNKFRDKLTKKDNLLVYYAGHGELDTTNLRGYWLPVDAEKDSNTNWISNDSITNGLNTMKAKHILVVVDSCYSGALSRTSIARLDSDIPEKAKQKWFKIMARTRSRTVLTSGGLAPILDSGGGNHSIFAQAFIDVLRNNNQVLEGQGLYRKLFTRVSTISARLGVEQNPQYAPIRHAGHEAGEFFFTPSDQVALPLRLNLATR